MYSLLPTLFTLCYNIVRTRIKLWGTKVRCQLSGWTNGCPSSHLDGDQRRLMVGFKGWHWSWWHPPKSHWNHWINMDELAMVMHGYSPPKVSFESGNFIDASQVFTWWTNQSKQNHNNLAFGLVKWKNIITFHNFLRSQFCNGNFARMKRTEKLWISLAVVSCHFVAWWELW